MPLATGGEKSVHKGVCVENGLEVVVKFLRKPFSHDDRNRFAVEIQRMLSAKPATGNGLSTVLDYNLESDPPFYVEEFFPDGSLAEKMAAIFQRKSLFTEGAAVGYCRQILQALHGIHSSNQIHRDVKPSNIMVRAREKKLVIVDMGLGRTLTRPTVLQTRAFCGTRGYAAPEQEMAAAVDHRADLYAVGVILHEMLTGERGAWNHFTFAGSPGVRQVAATLLQLNRQHRYASALHAAFAIDALGIATR
jgi:serine/threonine protein kinase